MIAQVRFPSILAVETRDFVAPFQEAIRADYPVLRQEQAQNLILGPGILAPGRPETVWRFAGIDGHWRVSLSPDFLALETTRYGRRSDFFERLGTVVQALEAHLEPKQVDRIGVRYIDRLDGSALHDLTRLVRPEVAGILGAPVAGNMVHSVTESRFQVGKDQMVARWGSLPPGSTVDPAAIEASGEQSWILDVDMSSSSPAPFAAQQITADAKRFAERIYAFFRWAVTDEFLRRFGGSP